ncbi:MAG TPA: hypothetical protein VFQ43_14275 [Nitrososphaera sp.]|nr:hypothetical protein [Nitrososphaera sp.]
MSPKCKTKKTKMFVIFAQPEQYGGGRNTYIALDGKFTKLKVKAAKFYSFNEAKQFAEEKNVVLSAVTYIGPEYF